MPVLNKYYEFVLPIWRKRYGEEAKTLANLRDVLLPVLISGELRIDKGERLVERSV
jgi:hypothetical protein